MSRESNSQPVSLSKKCSHKEAAARHDTLFRTSAHLRELSHIAFLDYSCSCSNALKVNPN